MSWGDLLVNLRESCDAGNHRYIPIQLTENAWPVDPRLGDRNFLRAWPLGGNERDAFVARRVVHALCKFLMRGSIDDREIPVTLFISHTKMDLEAEPQAVRALLTLLNAIQPEQTWFDSGDIDIGSRFAAEIARGIKDSALIAVLTDSYASRAWCRREVLLAKEFRRPVVVVDALRSGEIRSFPYVGNVPVIHWCDNPQEVVDLLLRENLRHLHASLCLERWRRPGDTLLPSAPELVTVIGSRGATILYPDPPLGEEEAGIVSSAGVQIETPLERFAKAVEGQHQTRTIALSVSESEDLGQFGLRSVHLDAAYIEISRYLLLAGTRLAYGGHLGKGGYSLKLFDLLKDPVVENLRHRGSVFAPQVISYIGWPVPLSIGQQARFGQLVDFRHVPRPDDIDEHLDSALVEEPECMVPADSPVKRFAWSQGMTRMRELQTAQVDARVVLGGKVGPAPGAHGAWYSSRIPGVVEEVLLSMRARKPVYLVGAFGGAARMILDLLYGRERTEMTWEYQKRAPYTEELRSIYAERGIGWEDYSTIVEFFRQQGISGLRNGLTVDQNRELANTRSVERMIELILHGIVSAETPSDIGQL